MNRRTAARLLTIGAITSAAACASTGARPVPPTDDPDLATAYRVLSTTPLVDGHNDLPWVIRERTGETGDLSAYDLRSATSGQTDIPRLRQGMVGGQFWSVYVPASAQEDGTAAKQQLEQIDIARRMIERYPDAFELALTPADVTRIFDEGKVASIIGMEGGHALQNSLGALRAYYRLGARYMTLTHSENIDWADSCCEAPEHGGLTPFGEAVVREMNRLGMLVDLAHVSPETMNDVLDVTAAPVIFSHSSARALTDHERNVPDAVLRRVTENGGVVMVTFVTIFDNEALRQWAELPSAERTGPAPVATLGDVADHIEHVRDVAGIDHVGIGSDFDGTSTPEGLEDVSKFPALFAELSRRGWSEEDLRKLAGQNVLRAWHQAERVAARLQSAEPPITATIAQLDGVVPEGSGAFVTRLGDDTLAVERFRYGATSFDADVALRVPRTVLTRYRAELDRLGRVRRLTATTYDPAGEGGGPPLGRTTYEFRGDSVRVDIRDHEEARQITVAAGRDALPFIDMVHWPFELAFLRHQPVVGGEEMEVPMIMGTRVGSFGFSAPATGHAVIRHPYRGTMDVRVDSLGQITELDASGSTRKLTVRRADTAAVDVAGLARDFAARDAAGHGIGALSGRATAEGEVGGASITVDYGVPHSRGRDIFGALVPFGEVWRTGANRATHFAVDRDLVIGDRRLPAGTYTLFTIPGPDAWTLIVNRQTDIAGTAYDASADFARIPMQVRTLGAPVEDLTITVDPAGFLRIAWGRTEASVRVRRAP